jgi:predicted O-methyltransferase YrrM
VKEALKRRLPGFRVAWRRLSRLRWAAKYRVVRYSGGRLLDPVALRYVLTDPEVESFAYELENVDELVAFCVDALGLGEARVRELIAEAQREPEFTTMLRARTRWAFDLKTQPPLGQRLLWWVIVRARKPSLIVETGVYEGLGALVLLVAAERNAAEGGPDARVIGIDADRRAGRLVPEHLKHRWEKVVGYSTDVLEDAIAGRPVDMLVHDTPHTREIQAYEFGVALRHAGDELTLVEGSGGTVDVLARLCDEHGTRLWHFEPRPRRHPYRPHGVDVATFRRVPAAAEPAPAAPPPPAGS